MTYFLDHLEPYKEEAMRRFQEGMTPERILFSSTTYQMFFQEKCDRENNHIHEKDGYWVFLQLDSQGAINDLFCSCPASSEPELNSSAAEAASTPACIHMASAFFHVFSGGERKPLHERFYSSPFHELLYALFLRKKNKSSLRAPVFRHHANGISSCQFHLDKAASVHIRGSAKQLRALQEACESCKEEATEETSIKISSLSEDELEAWRQGKPSLMLQYELSSLSEIAKFLFLQSMHAMVLGGSPALTLDACDPLSLLPTRCAWIWPNGFECIVEGMNEKEALVLLEVLARWSDAFPVASHSIISCDEIDPSKIRFSPQEKKLTLARYTLPSSVTKSSRPVALQYESNWMLSKDGTVYYKVGSKPSEEVLVSSEAIEENLNMLFERMPNSAIELQQIQQKIEVHPRCKEISCTSFYINSSGKSDEEVEIHREEHRYGRWIWKGVPSQEKKGRFPFFRLYGTLSVPFPKISVSGSHLEEFLLHHRCWLMKRPGFSLHYTSHEEHMTYTVDEATNALVFHSVQHHEAPAGGNTTPKNKRKVPKVRVCEFGSWIWREGEGFFPSRERLAKQKRTQLQPIRQNGRAWSSSDREFPHHILPLDTPTPPHRISHVIHKYAEALRHIPGFFAESSPVASTGLRIVYEASHKRIDISLAYTWKEASFAEKVKVYDDFGYIPGLGFFRMPTLPVQDHVMRYIYQKDREQWDKFFLDQLPYLMREYHCEVDPRLTPPSNLTLFCNRLSPKKVNEGEVPNSKELLSEGVIPEEWDVDFFWRSEKGEITLIELVKLLYQNGRFIPTPAGCIDSSSDRFLWVHSLVFGAGKRISKSKQKKEDASIGQVRLKTYDMLKIQAHDQFEILGAEEERAGAGSDFAHIFHRLVRSEPSIPPDISKLQSDLRPYQKHGLDWLWFLYTSGLSGLLCDDMGVGKTHQAMALVAAVYAYKQSRKVKDKNDIEPHAKFLIICPTSLVWHWKEKLERFLPDMRLFCYFSSERSHAEIEGPWNIFLTTYGIWRNEVPFLKKIAFDVAIFDELQIAKNHVSLVWSALAQVRASMRLGLTGTPIENQLRELKALFDLILPGYLPDDALFRELYIRPIERGEAYERKALLARSIRPFVLRRKKEDVLPELPEKTEEIFFAELASDQRSLYRQVASLQGLPLIHQLHDESQPIPYMHIFALLSALKQICNHPACYLKDVANYRQYESGKWQAFEELIEEARESGRKVVVFSQYLHMLDIMALYLTEMGIGHTEIRGRTRQRGKAIDRFHSDPECLVFLGSLQAAGLGIDLTAASLVIHYDRWWNAARENQATDRVHRIGQSRGVQVIKMLTKETVEERIDLMIMRKSMLLEEVIHYDDHQIVKRMSRHELLELLEGIEGIGGEV